MSSDRTNKEELATGTRKGKRYKGCNKVGEEFSRSVGRLNSDRVVGLSKEKDNETASCLRYRGLGA